VVVLGAIKMGSREPVVLAAEVLVLVMVAPEAWMEPQIQAAAAGVVAKVVVLVPQVAVMGGLV
jgi:hypothetical protein